jgi:NarL family two-component system response regulator LiaR
MVDGLSNPEIAKKLYVSRSTVKFHVSNILMKLGASSRTEAASMAIHGGLVK